MEQILRFKAPVRWSLSLVVIATLFCAARWCQATTVFEALDDIDYSRLVAQLGAATPNGAGVEISQVEASNLEGAYYPDVNHSQFLAATDPFSEAVNFIDGTGGAAQGTTNHATLSVGRNLYGNLHSQAGGANNVTIYEADDWLNNVLNLASGQTPIIQDFQVQNFSWIGTHSSNSKDRKSLRRFDYIIDTNDVTAVVGLNNGSDPLPHLLSHSYNAIAVGRTDGDHSTGVTQSFYGSGRSKPSLVVPRTTSSAATAMVSSSAALLHEVVAGTDGARSETMRAVLLAGATKGEITGWSHTKSQPLDSHFGVGELNVYNSYLMTLGGKFAGSTSAPAEPVGTHGWDYQTVVQGSDLHYNFEIPVGSTATELSIVLAWNVEVTDTDFGFLFSGSESLANLDLAFYDSTDQFLGSLVDESLSTIDNVEHIYLQDLEPGTYTLQVSTESARDFGLAWRLNTLFEVPSADFNEDGLVDGTDFLIWQRNYGTLLGATHVLGDSDGDGDVDVDDLAVFQSALPSSSMFSGTINGIFSVPEPGTIGLVLLAAASLWMWHRRLRSARQ